MKASTPPKLIPPFQSTAASGTFPIEQTKLSIATAGPVSGPQNLANVGVEERPCQNESLAPPRREGAGDELPGRRRCRGRRQPSHITESSPPFEVKPAGVRQALPPASLASDGHVHPRAWPSIAPSRPFSASARASFTRRRCGETCGRAARRRRSSPGRPRTRRPTNRQPRSTAMTIPSSMTRFVEAISNAIEAVKSAPLLEERPRECRPTRTSSSEEAAPSPGRDGERVRRVVGHEPPRISPLRDNAACTTPERAETEDERPENLPRHPERERERLP